MPGDWLSWKNVRLFVFDYWKGLLGAGAGILLLCFMVYFIHVQTSARSDRLNQLSVVRKPIVRSRPVQDVADVDQPLQGLLPPNPQLQRPVGGDHRPITSWGPAVQVSTFRVPEVPLQSPPSRSGPNG